MISCALITDPDWAPVATFVTPELPKEGDLIEVTPEGLPSTAGNTSTYLVTGTVRTWRVRGRLRCVFVLVERLD